MADALGATGPGDELRLLFFRSAGESFALDVAYVREIIPQQEVTPVPFVPPTVAGIINHRGTIYTLIRFSRLAGLGEQFLQDPQACIAAGMHHVLCFTWALGNDEGLAAAIHANGGLDPLVLVGFETVGFESLGVDITDRGHSHIGV